MDRPAAPDDGGNEEIDALRTIVRAMELEGQFEPSGEALGVQYALGYAQAFNGLGVFGGEVRDGALFVSLTSLTDESSAPTIHVNVCEALRIASDWDDGSTEAEWVAALKEVSKTALELASEFEKVVVARNARP